MAERLSRELLRHDQLNDYNAELLKLSLPDNEQTWLYSLPGSDPNSVVDLSEFLEISSACSTSNKFDIIHSNNGDIRSYAINTRTFTRQKKQYLNGNGKKQITFLNKNTINPDGSGRIQEKSPILSSSTPLVQSLKAVNLKNENINRKEHNTNIGALETIGVTPNLNTNDCINNNSAIKLNDISHSWNVSDRTFLFDVSAPKGIMDSTISSAASGSSHFSERTYVPFMPKSVSTPTRKIVYEDKTKYDISCTPETLDLDINIHNHTHESLANNTYDVLVTNIENSDENDNIHMNVTQIISTSKLEFENPANLNEEVKHKNILQNTFVLEGSKEENVLLNVNDSLPLPINCETSLSVKDDVNRKSDELINFPYDTDKDLNSTIIIKSKDNDSEDDSCYSSSSNLRSLGDVCTMSQLQPQTKKRCNLDSSLKKARSEELLFSAQGINCGVHPEKQHGSAINLAPDISNHFTGSKHHQRPHNSLKCPEKPAFQPRLSLMENNSKHLGVSKTAATRQLSKIPRPQSKIPKLNLKKVG